MQLQSISCPSVMQRYISPPLLLNNKCDVAPASDTRALPQCIFVTLGAGSSSPCVRTCSCSGSLQRPNTVRCHAIHAFLLSRPVGFDQFRCIKSGFSYTFSSGTGGRALLHHHAIVKRAPHVRTAALARIFPFCCNYFIPKLSRCNCVCVLICI
jgi:hypothetical protein